MQTATHSSIATMHEATTPQQAKGRYPPLNTVTKPNLTTGEAAHYLDRKPQTLYCWACHEDGPMRPTRINGRLAWSTSTVKALAGVTA